MIDFRYHLVSLISVFLALAVGIILGAGPLQGTIGDQLTNQVDDLRAERNDLRDALTASETDADQRLAFIEEAGPSLVEGSLEGLSIAIVDLDDVAADISERMVEAIVAAGGTVSSTAALTPAWTDEEHAGFRDIVASGMRPRLAALVADLPDDASTEELLAAALGVVLGGTGTLGSHGDDARALEQQLVQADLMTVDGETTTPADAVLLLSTASDEPATGIEASPAPGETALTSMVTLARTVQVVAPVVVAGPTAGVGDVVSSVRGDDGASERVSTVSGLETPIGRVVVPLALAAHVRGDVGQYGFEDGTTPLPPIVRPTAEDAATRPADGEPDAGGAEPDGAEPDGAEPDGAGQDGAGQDGAGPEEQPTDAADPGADARSGATDDGGNG